MSGTPQPGDRVRILPAREGEVERWGTVNHWPRDPKARGDWGRALVLQDGNRGSSFVDIERITTLTAEQEAAHRRMWGVAWVEPWATGDKARP